MFWRASSTGCGAVELIVKAIMETLGCAGVMHAEIGLVLEVFALESLILSCMFLKYMKGDLFGQI